MDAAGSSSSPGVVRSLVPDAALDFFECVRGKIRVKAARIFPPSMLGRPNHANMKGIERLKIFFVEILYQIKEIIQKKCS